MKEIVNFAEQQIEMYNKINKLESLLSECKGFIEWIADYDNKLWVCSHETETDDVWQKARDLLEKMKDV